MTTVVSTVKPPKLKPTSPEKRPPSKLTISKGEPNDSGATGYPNHPKPQKPEYIYEFSFKEFVVTDLNAPELIEFELDMEAAGKMPGIEEIYLHDYCCTRGGSMQPEKYWTESGNSENSDAKGFGKGVIGVAFRPRLAPNELINLGLIVAILKKGKNVPDLILCDPQVGNGPPATPAEGEVYTQTYFAVPLRFDGS